MIPFFFQGRSRDIVITIDRIEGDLAVCLDSKDERVYVIPCENFGFSVSEGDVLSVSFEKRDDIKANNEREIDSLFEKLKNRSSDR